MFNTYDADKVLSNAVRYLIHGGNFREAGELCLAEIDNITETNFHIESEGYKKGFYVSLLTGRNVFDIFGEYVEGKITDKEEAAAYFTEDESAYERAILPTIYITNHQALNEDWEKDLWDEGPKLMVSNEEYDKICEDVCMAKEILNSFKAVFGSDYFYLDVKIKLQDAKPDWKDEAVNYLEKRGISNQGSNYGTEPIKWENLNFRSPPEVRIAQELKRQNIMFLPNCAGLFSDGKEMKREEPDFLICHKGKWGILEVDGKTYHPSAAKDHAQGRIYKLNHIKVVERYDAMECLEDFVKIVRQFLEVLDKS